MKPTFEVVNEEPLTINVYEQKAAIGTIKANGQLFDVKGVYFELKGISCLEYAKSCFERAELQKADSTTKQIQLPIL